MDIDPQAALTVAATVEEGTLEAAAHRLSITPSAVSLRIKALEQTVGQRLVVRSKPVRATPAGLEVVRFARRFAVMHHETAERLGLTDASHRAPVAIAVNADSLATWLMTPLHRFAASHDVDLELLRDDQDLTVRHLEDGEVSAAVTTRADPVAGCRSIALGRMRFEPVAAPPWAARWAETLETAPRVDYDRRDGLQEQWLRRRGIDPRSGRRHLVPSVHALAEAIELGLGWGLVEAGRAEAGVRSGRLARLGQDPVVTDLYWQRWKGPSSLLDALSDELVSAARTALEHEDRRPS